jgi:ankyrin repeat protein
VGFRDGRITALSHDPAEDARERMVRALGGTVSPCFAVAHAWRGTTPGRLPRALRELRRHVLYALNHGDGDEVHRLLDQGLDPTGIRDRRGRTALHLMAQVSDPTLVTRLVEAGADVNAGDCYRRTPLSAAAFDGAPAAVVRALLDAGADATLTDDMEASALHVIRCLEADTVVPWLVEAGLDANAPDYGGRRPLLALLQHATPPEVFRALLAAGADPLVLHEYDQTWSIAGLVHRDKRTDLDFLVDAWRAAGGGAGG